MSTRHNHNSPTVQQSTAATAHPSAFCSCCRENGCIAAADAQAKFDEFEKRIEARFQSWEMQQDTFREYQTIQLGDRYGEAISRLQEDNQNLEWALRSQYREFQELQEREKRLVSEVDELKEQLKQYQRADEEDRKM
ncbi:hypothetical protein BD410DRAFT_794826 [Rickenella mellea]|uniref:Uncharacterized protein n=1 Tax=Rickenella mellea TaxID=50990 RepID=A0A4Y7PNB1_9AGAM|nr:hypothetical protein BD410DRAFT_794826 [Rickenella mellea]